MSVTRHYDKSINRYAYYAYNNNIYYLANCNIYYNNTILLNKCTAFAVTLFDQIYIIASNKNNLILLDQTHTIIDSIFLDTIMLIRAYSNLIYAQHADGIYKFTIEHGKLHQVANYKTDKKLRAVCNILLLTNGKNYYYCDLSFTSLIETILDDSYFVFLDEKNNILHNSKVYNVNDCIDYDIEPLEPGEPSKLWH